MLVVPNVGEVELLKYILGMSEPDAPVIHLYTNEITPSNTTVKGDLTECSTTGYVPITLVSASWGVSTADQVTTASYAEQTFTFGTNVSVWGYYVTDQSGTPKLLWAEKFSGAPFTIPDGGGTISITPKVTLN